MVSKINLPSEDSIEVWKNVFLQRSAYRPYKKFYNLIYQHIIAQYALYINCGGDPNIVKPLELINFTSDITEAAARKLTLQNLYAAKRNKKPYEILDAMRRKHKLLYCPTCGEDGSPGTLDHYLPKDVFPELAICLANLTPMCSRCQEEKSTTYQSESGGKAFFHPYFDIIDQCLFKVEITPPFNAPSDFKIIIRENISAECRILAKNHLAGLYWVSRFRTFCEQKHLHLLRMVSEERDDEEPLSAGKIARICLRQEEQKSFNSWGAIYYRSVLESAEFLDYLNNAELPDNL
ncbi:hypothetical protein [Erwinia amylovora]|uniref:hypothetical protein n=1 Tax=Erwinia amylovora TaxID=552 RepID=UPI00144489A0|nr:hypothetical protein [Erwinia amylovora]